MFIRRKRSSPLPVYNFKKNAKTSGNIRDINWLGKRIKKGIIGKDWALDSDTIIKQLGEMIEVLDDLHGEDWDFDLSVMECHRAKFDLHVIIHYPNITIVNSQNQSHKITDLIVKFKLHLIDIGVPHLSPGILYGYRLSCSRAEKQSNYQHSHLPSKFYDENMIPQKFCLGDGTDLIIQKQNLVEEYSKIAFEMYVLCIKSMLEWESAEGVPYISISTLSIARATDSINPIYRNYSKFRNVVGKIEDMRSLPIPESFNIEISLVNGKYEVFANQNFILYLYYLITSLLGEDALYDEYLCKKVNGIWYKYNRTSAYEEIPYREFLLRDKIIKSRVTDNEEDGEENKIGEYTLHPELIQLFKEYIDYEINKKAIKKTVYKIYKNRRKYAKKYIKEDCISLPTNI